MTTLERRNAVSRVVLLSIALWISSAGVAITLAVTPGETDDFVGLLTCPVLGVAFLVSWLVQREKDRIAYIAAALWCLLVPVFLLIALDWGRMIT